MNTQTIFDIFNHFITSRDPNQIMALADNVEVFGSTTFGDGKTYIGEKAPGKFRETISVAKVSKPKISLVVKHAVVNDNHALFFMDIIKGKKRSGSALDVVVENGKLKCFHEVKTNM